MLSVFPDTGDIVAVDTSHDTEFALDVTGRRVEGLGDFFRSHALEVNDEVVVRPLEDGRFGITAFKRDRRPDYTRPDVQRRLLDDIIESSVPATESEIRALHPDLPESFPLRATLEQDDRLTLHEGRWQSTAVVEALLRAAELEAERRHEEARRRAEAAEAAEAQRRAEAAEREASVRAAAEREAAAKRAQEERDRLNEQAADDTRAAAQRERASRDERRESDDEGAEGAAANAGDERFDWNEPLGRTFRLPWQRQRPEKPAAPEGVATNDPFRLDRLGDARPTSSPRPTVVPTPRSGLFPGDAALNSESLPADPAKTKRAREAFASFGYRIEGLAHGQLMLHADLGRRQYRTLLHVLPDGERLDWAALLARRRDSNAKYLAVVGDHRDLHRLTAPADLARATLWSWAGVDRVRELLVSTMIGPVDLEPHFERDGMFEYGLERFERTIAKRIQERGTLSAVLTALAGMRAPTVFVLEDLAAHGDVPRDQLVRVLERLSEAPFHLVSKVDSGEFCLRYRVHDALDQLGAYAMSLRTRLPERQRDRVRGLPEGVEPIDVHDVPSLEPRSSAPRAPERESASHATERETVPVKAPRPATTKASKAKAATKPEGRQVLDAAAGGAPMIERAERRSSAPLFMGPGFAQAFGEDEDDEFDLSSSIERSKGTEKG